MTRWTAQEFDAVQQRIKAGSTAETAAGRVMDSDKAPDRLPAPQFEAPEVPPAVPEPRRSVSTKGQARVGCAKASQGRVEGLRPNEPPLRSFSLTLSWPPSANHGTKHPAKGVHYLTERHRSYRQEVVQEVYQRRIQKLPIRGRYWAEVNFHAPDRRRRDADNLTKILFDALVNAGAIADDCNLRQLIMHWHEWVPASRGRVVLHVFEI